LELQQQFQDNKRCERFTYTLYGIISLWTHFDPTTQLDKSNLSAFVILLVRCRVAEVAVLPLNVASSAFPFK